MDTSLRDEVRNFKSILLELATANDEDNKEELNKIIETYKDSDKLFHTLILLYSNSKSDLQSIKAFQLRTLLSFADKLEACIIDYQNNIYNLQSAVNSNFNKTNNNIENLRTSMENMNNKMKTGFFHTGLGKVVTVFFIIIFTFFIIHTINPSSAEFAGKMLEKTFSQFITNLDTQENIPHQSETQSKE